MRMPLVIYLLTLSSYSLAGSAPITYEGRHATASWRVAAAHRIEAHRKGTLTITVVDSNGDLISGANVTVAMRRHSFGFGSAVAARVLCDNSENGRRYREVIEQNFNKVVFENDLKWRPWEVSRSNTNRGYRREWTEKGLAWMNDRKISIRGHYVSWAPLKPQELSRYQGKPALLRKDLFAHIEDKLPAVGTRVDEWDAVNHIVGWGTTLADLLGGDSIYVEIIKRSRTLAPHAAYWINEGQVLPGGTRRDNYERIARYLVAQGAAPDGIGFMGHFSHRSLTPPEEVLAVFDRFAKVVPKLQLTEFDVDVGQDQQLQADYLRDIMTAAFSHPAITGVVMWGFWEGRHWKPDAALYRRDWSVKPAGRIWKDLVFKTWWTDTKGLTDSSGSFSTSGFLGDYEIAATSGGRSMRVKAVLPKAGSTVKITLK